MTKSTPGPSGHPRQRGTVWSPVHGSTSSPRTGTKREAHPSCPPPAEVPRFIGAEVENNSPWLMVKLPGRLKCLGQFSDARGRVFEKMDAQYAAAFFHERAAVRTGLRLPEPSESHD